jgi:hypothetical protein
LSSRFSSHGSIASLRPSGRRFPGRWAFGSAGDRRRGVPTAPATCPRLTVDGFQRRRRGTRAQHRGGEGRRRGARKAAVAATNLHKCQKFAFGGPSRLPSLPIFCSDLLTRLITPDDVPFRWPVATCPLLHPTPETALHHESPWRAKCVDLLMFSIWKREKETIVCWFCILYVCVIYTSSLELWDWCRCFSIYWSWCVTNRVFISLSQPPFKNTRFPYVYVLKIIICLG